MSVGQARWHSGVGGDFEGKKARARGRAAYMRIKRILLERVSDLQLDGHSISITLQPGDGTIDRSARSSSKEILRG